MTTPPLPITMGWPLMRVVVGGGGGGGVSNWELRAIQNITIRQARNLSKRHSCLRSSIMDTNENYMII